MSTGAPVVITLIVWCPFPAEAPQLKCSGCEARGASSKAKYDSGL